VRRVLLYVLGALLMAPVLGVVAQQRPRGADITLVYEREVFTYRGSERRDPFTPLTQENQMGPRFQELSLQGIIYSNVPGESLALIQAGGGRVLRARVGDVIGNSRVIEIGPTRVVMAVENFGTIRQEILELPQRGGAER
jgi:type II secretory pathway component PulC